MSHVDHDLHARDESGLSRRDVLCAGGRDDVLIRFLFTSPAGTVCN